MLPYKYYVITTKKSAKFGQVIISLPEGCYWASTLTKIPSNVLTGISQSWRLGGTIREITPPIIPYYQIRYDHTKKLPAKFIEHTKYYFVPLLRGIAFNCNGSSFVYLMSPQLSKLGNNARDFDCYETSFPSMPW